MNLTSMNYDIKYISPAGTRDETFAEVTITLPIKQRVDAQKFILEIKNDSKLKNLLLERINELRSWKETDLGLTDSGKQSLLELERLYEGCKK